MLLHVRNSLVNFLPKRCSALSLFSIILGCTGTLLHEALYAQDDPFGGGGVTVVQTTSDGQTVVVQQDGIIQASPAMQLPPGASVPPGTPMPGGATPPGVPPNGAPGSTAKPGDASKPSPDGPIKRENVSTEPPNKREFDIRPDEEGMIQFQFRNQEWPDLLAWLADVSNMTLDWQELPNSRVNLSTKRKFSVEEARDLFNRHLLLRGYTMLELDSTLQVVKTEGINVTLVPKIPAEMLESLPPNRFVRTSFPLRSLVAATVVDSFKSLISKNGSLTALESTNRLEAMDCAGNLAEIYRMLEQEQSEEALDRLVQEFELEFVRAEIVKEQLSTFLGVSQGKANARPMSPEEQMMMQQQQQMMMQQMQQQQMAGGAKPPKPAEKEIHITANTRRNSVIVHAPPNKMALVEAFVKRVDVPNNDAATLQRLETRMRVHRLASLDPKQLVASVVAMDVLEPTTKLEVDEKNRSIIVYGSLSDQLVIQQVIDRLDGSAREMEVIQLRRLRAEDVANTIKFLFGEEKEKDDSRNNRFFFDPWGSQKNDKDEKKDDFRVAANTQDNQVLLWANEIETKEVYKLLEKLGEIPPKGAKRSNVRIIDASRTQETKEYLEKLKDAWSQMSSIPLTTPDETEFPRDETSENVISPKSPSAPPSALDSDKANESTQPPALEKSNDVTMSESSIRGRLSSFIAPPEESSEIGTNEKSSDNSSRKAGVQIRFDEKGNLVLSGDDLDALDQLEQLMTINAPPQPGYEVFYLKDARPIWVELNLKDYFKEEDKKDGGDAFRFIFGFDAPNTKKEDPRIGKKRALRFISDPDTSSIVVIGADEKQLKTIRSLIKLWDVPEKPTKQKLRYSKLVKIEYSKAESIVETMKDAYRDLLSTNDKAFSKGKEDKESKHDGGDSTVESGGAMNYSFTGKLSMGVDRITNSILVSAEGEDLLKLVIEMIKELDVAAKPTGSVQMLSVGGTNSEALEKALLALLSKKEQQQPNNGQNRGIPNQENGGGPFSPQDFPSNFGGDFNGGSPGGTRNSKRR
jgi:type II secretory pathway component GspD/PulD (secretin)